MCCCCCVGRTSANRYDRLFIIYVILVISAVSTFVWAFYERIRYVGQVCSGDFITNDGLHGKDGDQQIMLWDEMENDFYLISCGRLLKYFIVIESFFVFCCCCSTSVWVAITPNSFSRFSTTVEYSQAAQQREVFRDRLELKRQIQETDRIVLDKMMFSNSGSEVSISARPLKNANKNKTGLSSTNDDSN